MYRYLPPLTHPYLPLTAVMHIGCDHLPLSPQGALPNDADFEGDTPLALCGKYNRVEIAQMLLARGADPLVMIMAGLAPVHRAAEFGHLPILKLLLPIAPDKLFPTNAGRTLVHVAAAFGQVGIGALAWPSFGEGLSAQQTR